MSRSISLDIETLGQRGDARPGDGIYMLVFLGGAPLGSPLAGWVAQEFGPRMSMMSGGIISVLATLAVAAMLVRSRGVRVLPYLRPARLVRILV
jgi:MFS family permease